MLRVDQVLNQRYRIVRQLGHGGMGAVYEAIDERFGEPIALKEIVFASSSEVQKELVIKAFEREAKALAKAQHEAIPYVRDYFSELDRQFLVMELIEGDDLAGLLVKRQSPFPLPDCLKWLDQLLDALDYLHTLERPIIHRDIKPQNLKLNRRGKIKLLDFGIAKSADSAASTLSDQTFIGATLDYSPVEQILRAMDPTFREYILLKHREKAEHVLRQTTDTRCDLYSLGATFCHLLTNKPPPDAVKRTLEVWEARPDPLTNPSVTNASIPLGVSACLLQAMSIEREGRFTSALEMQEALQKAIAEDKVLESSVYNVSWEAEQVRLQIVDEERLREQALMQAKTVNLIAEDVPAINTGGENIQGLPTEPLLMPHSNAGSPGKIPVEESLSISALDTIPPGGVSGTALTGTSYTSETTGQSAKTDVYEARPVAVSRPAGKKTSGALPKVIWILVAAIVGVLALGGGIGAGLWIINSDNSAAGNNTPTPSPTPTPTSTPTLTPAPSPTAPVVEPTRSVEPTPDRTPERTPQPTPMRTPEKTPWPTPVRTPIRIPPRKTPNPNCIYNNTCR